MRPLLAALLGAVAIFVWFAVAHMFTPLGMAGIDYLPKEDANVPHWNWYSFPGTYAVANMFMAIVAMFFAGLVIAAVSKPAATDR